MEQSDATIARLVAPENRVEDVGMANILAAATARYIQCLRVKCYWTLRWYFGAYILAVAANPGEIQSVPIALDRLHWEHDPRVKM